MKSIQGKALSVILFFAGALFLNPAMPSGQLRAMASAPSGQEPAPAPDNTKVNKGDEDSARPTADRQKENSSDRNTTRQIRRALMKDKSLSTYAHNVKIITQDGIVTLKGPVRTEEEKETIEAKAKEVAGADKVTNELEVKPKT